MVLGKLTGYSFVSYRIGSFLFKIEEGKLKVSRFAIKGTAGQCAMLPPKDVEDKDVDIVPYYLGGVLFNLITGLILIPLFLLCDNIFVKIIIYMLGAISLAMVFLNLYPQKIMMPNDGYCVKLARKNQEDHDELVRMLRIEGDREHRLRQMDENYFVYSEEGELSVSGKLMAALRYEDMHEFEKAEELLRESADKEKSTIKYHRLEAACELLFCLIMNNRDGVEIEKLYDEELQKYLDTTKKYLAGKRRVLYAYQLLYKKNEEEAEKEYQEALRLLRDNTSRNDRIMEEELLKEIKNRS